MNVVGPASKDAVLIDAFKHVFRGAGKDAQTDLVLAELAEFSGYYGVPEEGTSDAGMHRDAGRREVFARILYLLGVSPELREAIRQAAFRELEAFSNAEG